MSGPSPQDEWSSGDAYEAYVGRWSRVVGAAFVGWLGVDGDRRWLDAGCGTGALTEAIVESAEPAAVVGIDASPAYVEAARQRVVDRRVRFAVGDAMALGLEREFDVAVSGLVLNFLPDPLAAVTGMARAVSVGGVVASHVWDYAGGMELMRYCWDAAVALDDAARELDEGVRFPLCRPDRLRELWQAAGLHGVETRAIDIPTRFEDFDDYWAPFLGAQGPAPGYVASRTPAAREALRRAVRSALPVAADGSITLTARAWAVRGTVA